MENPSVSPTANDDPRKLREILTRAANLACEHSLTSVMVGMAGSEGDLQFPEIVDYVESELRMEDAIFRMTRERVVLLVADVDRTGAEEIMQRVMLGYCERSSRASDPNVSLSYFEVGPDSGGLSVKEVLPALFISGPPAL
jgi:hypothetical protein